MKSRWSSNTLPQRWGLPWILVLATLFRPGEASSESQQDHQVRERQVKTLARVLAYDENLTGRAEYTVELAVLYRSGSPDSEKEASAWFDAYSKLGSYSIRGLPFHAFLLPFTTAEAVEKSIVDAKAVALYVCPGLDHELATIRKISQRRKATTVASREEQMTAGLALGVFPDQGKLVLVVNLPQSRAEGAQFGSELLRLAKIIQ